MFKVEDLVVVTGLKKDKDLNGAMGIVVGHAPDKVDKSVTRHKVRSAPVIASPFKALVQSKNLRYTVVSYQNENVSSK